MAAKKKTADSGSDRGITAKAKYVQDSKGTGSAYYTKTNQPVTGKTRLKNIMEAKTKKALRDKQTKKK